MIYYWKTKKQLVQFDREELSQGEKHNSSGLEDFFLVETKSMNKERHPVSIVSLPIYTHNIFINSCQHKISESFSAMVGSLVLERRIENERGGDFSGEFTFRFGLTTRWF